MYNPKLKKTIISLRISSILYFAFGLLTPIALFSAIIQESGTIEFYFIAAMFIFAGFGMGIFLEVLINGLKKKKPWSWLTAVIICGIYIPSGFMILGIIGMIGLLDPEVKQEYGH